MSNFKIGQKVACINAKSANTPMDGSAPMDLVDEGVYTIRSIEYFDDTPMAFLELTIYPGVAFESCDFRPLDYDFVDAIVEQIKNEIYEPVTV